MRGGPLCGAAHSFAIDDPMGDGVPRAAVLLLAAQAGCIALDAAPDPGIKATRTPLTDPHRR